MDVLKAETVAEHRAVESAMPLMKQDVSFEEYRWFLEKMWGFLAPIEDQLWLIEALPEAVPDISSRWKAPLLYADLRACGLRLRDIEKLPHCKQPPPTQDLASALGYLYVVEGSTLGGQILMRQLGSRLGVTAESGAAYLSSYGTDVGRNWNRFRDSMRAAVRTEDEVDQVVSAAHETFESLLNWLEFAPGCSNDGV